MAHQRQDSRSSSFSASTSSSASYRFKHTRTPSQSHGSYSQPHQQRTALSPIPASPLPPSPVPGTPPALVGYAIGSPMDDNCFKSQVHVPNSPDSVSRSPFQSHQTTPIVFPREFDDKLGTGLKREDSSSGLVGGGGGARRRSVVGGASANRFSIWSKSGERKKLSRKALVIGLLVVAVLAGGIIAGSIVAGTKHHDTENFAGPDSPLSAGGSGGSRSGSASDPSSTSRVGGSGTNSTHSGPGYDNLVVFGASYCDDGHTRPANLSMTSTQSPYWEGRWSDGPVWDEYLAGLIGNKGQNATLYNMAYGGAMVDNSIFGAPAPDLRQQISTYLSTQKTAPQGRTLIAIWIGLNPVFAFWNRTITSGISTSSRTQAVQQINATISSLFDQLTTLSLSPITPATSTDFLLIPLPPGEILPLAQSSAVEQTTGSSSAVRSSLALMKTMSQVYNSGLDNAGRSLRSSLQAMNVQSGVGANSGGQVWTWNATDWWYNVTGSPGQFGFQNVTSPCYDTSKACNDASTRLYWDTLHPTTAAHKQIADRIFTVLFPPS